MHIKTLLQLFKLITKYQMEFKKKQSKQTKYTRASWFPENVFCTLMILSKSKSKSRRSKYRKIWDKTEEKGNSQ